MVQFKVSGPLRLGIVGLAVAPEQSALAHTHVAFSFFSFSSMFLCVCIKTPGSKWEFCSLRILSAAQVGGAGNSATGRAHENQVSIHNAHCDGDPGQFGPILKLGGIVKHTPAI